MIFFQLLEIFLSYLFPKLHNFENFKFGTNILFCYSLDKCLGKEIQKILNIIFIQVQLIYEFFVLKALILLIKANENQIQMKFAQFTSVLDNCVPQVFLFVLSNSIHMRRYDIFRKKVENIFPSIR